MNRRRIINKAISPVLATDRTGYWLPDQVKVWGRPCFYVLNTQMGSEAQPCGFPGSLSIDDSQGKIALETQQVIHTAGRLADKVWSHRHDAAVRDGTLLRDGMGLADPVFLESEILLPDEWSGHAHALLQRPAASPRIIPDADSGENRFGKPFAAQGHTES